jgi:tRNA(Ser,Leu) C12 N-acetylase TAN1
MNVKLIVTYDPAHQKSCMESLKNVMDSVGAKPKFLKSKYSGIFLIELSKPKEVVKMLMKLNKKDPEIFGKTHRYIPVDKWVSSKVPDMQKAIKLLVPKIGENEKWKMDLEKRHYHKLDYQELIVKLTEVVDRRKIDLKKPKKIIKVEIIGTHAGISLLEPGELLMVP